MIRPISLGTRPGGGVSELGAEVAVVDNGPAATAPVSDVWAAATDVSAAVLFFAADAAFVPPLQAAANTMIETRTVRYIFPGFWLR